MSKEKVGFGLVGLGMAAETHAQEIREVKDAELVAVYGRNEEKARKFAERFGVKHWYSSYPQMLENKDIHIVNIVTPHAFHHDFAIPAAEAGKHVIIDKPIEITMERANSIIKACRQHKVKLAVIYQMRFGRGVQKVKRAIDAGLFGKLFMGDAYDKGARTQEYYDRDSWRGTKQYEGGGALMTQTIHQIDVLQWLMGPAESVYAKTKTATHTIEVEDLAVGLVTFRNGAIGTIAGSTSMCPALKSRIEVHGDKGSAIVNAQYDQLLYWDIRDSAEKVDTPKGFKFGDISDPRLFPQVRHRYQFQDMIEAIRDNREPVVNGEEGKKALAIVLAMYQSAETGKEVAIS